MFRTSSFKLVLVVVALVGALSCTRDSSKTAISKSALISRVPPDAVALALVSNASSAAKRFRESSFASSLYRFDPEKFRDKVEGLVEVTRGLQKVGLLDEGHMLSEVLADGVGFISIASESAQLSGGFFAARAGSTNLSDKIGALESVLKSEGITVSPITLDAVSGIEITVPEASRPLIVAASQDKIAVATSRDLASRLFESVSQDFVHPILSSERYKEAVVGFDASNQFSLLYADVDRVVQAIKRSGIVPANQAADLDRFPLGAIAVSHEFGEHLTSLVNLTYSAKTEEEKKLFATLASTAKSADLSRIPSGYLAALSLDFALIKEIKNILLQQGNLPNAGDIARDLAFLDALSHLEIAAFPMTGASPFPEFLIAVSGAGASEALEKLKAAGSQSLAPMAGGAQWKERKVGEVSVFSMPSPLGLEPTLALTGNTLLVSASGPLMDRAVQSYASSRGTGLTNILKSLQKGDATVDGVALVVIDLPKVAAAVETAQGTFALLTGGQNAVDPETLRVLRSAGTVGVRAKNLESRLSIEATYRQSEGS